MRLDHQKDFFEKRLKKPRIFIVLLIINYSVSIFDKPLNGRKCFSVQMGTKIDQNQESIIEGAKNEKFKKQCGSASFIVIMIWLNIFHLHNLSNYNRSGKKSKTG